MLRRVRRAYDEETSPGITLKDYLNFYQVRMVILGRVPTFFQFSCMKKA